MPNWQKYSVPPFGEFYERQTRKANRQEKSKKKEKNQAIYNSTKLLPRNEETFWVVTASWLQTRRVSHRTIVTQYPAFALFFLALHGIYMFQHNKRSLELANRVCGLEGIICGKDAETLISIVCEIMNYSLARLNYTRDS